MSGFLIAIGIIDGASNLAPEFYTNKASTSIKHLVFLNAYDKIRIVAKSVNGETVLTVPESVRLTIRKKL